MQNGQGQEPNQNDQTDQTAGEQTSSADTTNQDGLETIEDLRAEIARLRDALSSVNSESAQRRVRLREYEQQEEERRQSEMTLQERYDQAVANLATAQSELASSTQSHESVVSALTSHLDALKQQLPEHITGLLNQLEPVAQLNYLTENQASLLRRNGSTSSIDGSSGTPRRVSRRVTSEQIVEAKRRRDGYGSL